MAWRVRWVCGGDEEVKVEAEEEFGSRTVRKVRDPKAPTSEEREEHEKTHLPFRSWCRRCVRGRWKLAPHCRGAQETTMCEVHMD